MLQPNPRLMGAELCSPAAYGHTGFTGTSLVIDPGFGIWVVLLTNRVHPSRTDGSLERVNALRARFHNLVVAALAEATPARPVTLSEAHADGADA
jgi:CubicO group peptidase (beta-lactamase class C family)